MSVYLDTSVVTSALVQEHPFFHRAASVFSRAQNGLFGPWIISQHLITEVFCSLTRVAVTPRITPQRAWVAIEENILPYATCSDMLLDDYKSALQQAVSLGIVGGTTYDALHTYCAEKANVDVLYTFNTKHFLRVWPAGATKIIEP